MRRNIALQISIFFCAILQDHKARRDLGASAANGYVFCKGNQQDTLMIEQKVHQFITKKEKKKKKLKETVLLLNFKNTNDWRWCTVNHHSIDIIIIIPSATSLSSGSVTFIQWLPYSITYTTRIYHETMNQQHKKNCLKTVRSTLLLLLWTLHSHHSIVDFDG